MSAACDRGVSYSKRGVSYRGPSVYRPEPCLLSDSPYHSKPDTHALRVHLLSPLLTPTAPLILHETPLLLDETPLSR